ncbi:serine hydrolase domain-containing protein [Bradyrhizobium sp. cf659]|uniref:serine hydrolase domain-containing protein n=1 Tax=Bradyrhizobium sp. cf659 TaxID=1761771 RepID=UPI0008F2B7DB|nr:serine hydrolase domain-containing protein [Bradyrhizobium sp. cf659]SFJ61036.1 CubicO group peptidase, beta-lactamase class C family [Bradyrhizobium sp. cf659]
MALSDPSSAIQTVIDAVVSDYMGMAVYVFTDFDGSGTPSAKFFSPSQTEVWDSNHKVVAAANLPNTLFEIGSISKVFTSRIFYSLQGTYDGNTVGSCMPSISLPAAISGIPVADIVTYASGFPQDNGLPPDPRGPFCPPSNLQNFTELVAWFNSGQHSAWICPPGQCYTYSNLAWSLLAIAGANPQNTYVDVYDEYNTQLVELCAGLGMNNTALFNTGQVPSMACGYDGTQPFDIGHSYLPCPPMEFGSGSIVSCASDMLQWLLYNMGQLQPSPTEFAILQTQQQTGWTRGKCGTATGICGGPTKGPTVGIGWFFPKIAGAAGSVLSKDGGVPGFSSWMGFESWVQNGASAPSGNGVVVLSAGSLASPVGQKIMSILLNAEVEAGLSSS